MRIEFDNDSYVYSPIKVELDEEEVRVVKANRDGTYQVLVFDGKNYYIYMRAKITAFESYDDSEGVLYKMTTKEIWDSWGKDLPEEPKIRLALQSDWDKFFDGGDQK